MPLQIIEPLQPYHNWAYSEQNKVNPTDPTDLNKKAEAVIVRNWFGIMHQQIADGLESDIAQLRLLLKLQDYERTKKVVIHEVKP